ncbi:hypothetical protein LTS17_000433 [Exophiala oligosperma]
MGNYSDYQGPVAEWEDFIKSTGEVPAPPLHLPILEMRSLTNAGRTVAAQEQVKALGLKEKVAWQDYSILTRDSQNITARVYKPKVLATNASSSATSGTGLPIYLYFHGGGHLLGNVDSEDGTCSRLVGDSSFPLVVVNVNYRHTPEFPWPTQFNDAWDSLVWLSTHATDFGGDPSKVVVGGVSAGGGLAASIAVHHHRQRLLQSGQAAAPAVTILGQVLASPWLLHPSANPLAREARSSFNQNQNAPVLPWSILKVFADLLGPEAVSDPSFNVALTDDTVIQGLPKTSCLVAGQDLLRDEGLYYAEKLKKNE